MTWYNQTHAFFDTHYDEIEEMRAEYEECVDGRVYYGRDLKNSLTWFAFEAAAYQMADEMGLL